MPFLDLILVLDTLILHVASARTLLIMLEAWDVVVYFDECEPAGKLWVALFWPLWWLAWLIRPELFD